MISFYIYLLTIGQANYPSWNVPVINWWKIYNKCDVSISVDGMHLCIAYPISNSGWYNVRIKSMLRVDFSLLSLAHLLAWQQDCFIAISNINHLPLLQSASHIYQIALQLFKLTQSIWVTDRGCPSYFLPCRFVMRKTLNPAVSLLESVINLEEENVWAEKRKIKQSMGWKQVLKTFFCF